MRCVAAVMLGVGVACILVLAAQPPALAQEKKESKKTVSKDAKPPNLEGKYTLVAGKVNDKPMDEAAKKWSYVFTSDTITIADAEPKNEGKQGEKALKFVFSYKLDTTTAPIHIDMSISEGPEGTKGSKAAGIVEVKGDVLKLAYTMEKDKRPGNFDGKEGNSFEFKKMK